MRERDKAHCTPPAYLMIDKLHGGFVYWGGYDLYSDDAALADSILEAIKIKAIPHNSARADFEKI